MDGIEIVAGIDVNPVVLSDYPVFASLEECNTEADVIVDFASAKAVDHLLDYCGAHKMPLVLCTTGLSPEQIEKVKETSRQTAILRSANMSLGINTLMKLVQDAAWVCFRPSGTEPKLKFYYGVKADSMEAADAKAAELGAAVMAIVEPMLG